MGEERERREKFVGKKKGEKEREGKYGIV